jgi:RNA polymerase sigma-70 factor (ECF subfamily)
VPVLRHTARARRLDPEQLSRHLDRLFRAAWAICGDPHEAEDLVQETCARVLARPRWLRHGDELGYLLQVLRNTHVSGLRRARARPSEVPLDQDAELGAATSAADPVGAFEAGELFAAISALPQPAREAIVAVDVMGMSYREAAAALRVKEATVTTRLHRARRRVVDSLTSEPEHARTGS